MEPLIFAVMGASYGDEGKGRVVDGLVATHRDERQVIVVRNNGGAQAGHTVWFTDEDAQPRHHVFRQVGSGALAGASTFIGPRCLLDPVALSEELNELHHFITPRVYIDPRAEVVTLYDVMINQLIERARGARAHGSCGMGIFETTHRGASGYSITIKDLSFFIKYGTSGLLKVRDEWVPTRLHQLGLDLDELSESARWVLTSGEALEQWLNFSQSGIEIFNRNPDVTLGSLIDVQSEPMVIFEGAQGLALDRDNVADFPHLTPSHTGLKNVVELVEEIEAPELMIKPIYVTRPYLTRHGPGPLPNERSLTELAQDGININLRTETNVKNEFQGSFRYGLLDVDHLIARIIGDASKAILTIPKIAIDDYQLAMTHVDELSDVFSAVIVGEEQRVTTQELSDSIFLNKDRIGLLSF